MIALPAPDLTAERAARRLAHRRLPAWWTSPRDGDGTGGDRTDFVASDPVAVVEGSSIADLADAWAQARARWGGEVPPGLPIGLGYVSYDLGENFHGGPWRDRAKSGWPPLHFRFYDAIWVRESDGATVIRASDPQAAARLVARLGESASPCGAETRVDAPTAYVPVEPPTVFLDGVRRVKEYLRAGDVYQVNLARRLAASFAATDGNDASGVHMAARLARQSPAPHAIWLGFSPGRFLLGNSPERFLHLGPDRRIETCPIKGTRARLAGHDEQAVRDLVASPKDRAEHVMIVDLERNDLGRVCETGSVVVHDVGRPITLPTVHHLVTTVRGRLRRDVELGELLAATFPGGSITGAPKRRAMQIIAELENAHRGPYTGATGWLGAAGDIDLAVAIRTAVVNDGRILLWVGGGIVADSDPESELRETDVKAEAFARLRIPSAAS